MDVSGPDSRRHSNSARNSSPSPIPQHHAPNGSRHAAIDVSSHDRNGFSRSSPPPPASSSASRRRSRVRVGKGTQSPVASSQPPSRRGSPSREAASTAGDPTGPSPYGTRSRNRTGVNRPNYAEDPDDNMDYEYGPSKASQSSTPAPPSKTQSPDPQKSFSSSQGRRPGPSSRAGAAHANEIQKGADSIVVASVKEETGSGVGRKRKAQASQTTSASAAHGAPSAKRRANALAKSTLARPSAMPTFEACGARLSADGALHADDGTVYRANDYVYLVCEPPGEPYYIARVMEFLHANNDLSAPIDEIRINWIYRPRDIGRKATDNRVLFASMHSDPCPVASLRGKCNVQHRSEIGDFDSYRKGKDNFYFSQMYDRYMRRYYELIPMKQVINVPEHIKNALDQRWKYVSVEIGRGKELISAVKTCKRCAGYCANNDSVDCAVCKLTYHMHCVQPPLQKKPSRGFGWSCGPCSRKQERKLEARTTQLLGNKKKISSQNEEEEVVEEEEEIGAVGDTDQASALRSSSPESIDVKISAPKATKEQLAQAGLWPYRYLGIHCKIEDSLDYDDRIYPRSSSRLGPRHQANVNVWHGRPVEYIKPAESRRKYGKAAAKGYKPTKETLSAVEEEKKAKEKRPRWVLDEPTNYVRRGEDYSNSDPSCTAQLLYKPPPSGIIERGMDEGMYEGARNMSDQDREAMIDRYMQDCRKIASSLGIESYHTNYLDRALQMLEKHQFNVDAAKKEMRNTDVKKDLKEPKLSKEDHRKFEEAIPKYGSNMVEVARHVGKVPKGFGDVVRHYYMWKKTPRGKQIWSSYEGRKPKKKTLETPVSALADDVADDHDDSAFDNDKAAKKKRGFECKHCGTRNSRFWRRAPATAPGAVFPPDIAQKTSKEKGQQLMVALCQRCAGLYRKYGLHWEDIDEVARRVAQTGGRAFKRKQDEELLIELININEEYRVPMAPIVGQAALQLGMEVSPSLIISADEVAKKKKADKLPPPIPEKETAPAAIVVPEPQKKKVVEKPVEPPLVPEQPRFKQQPCAVCLFELPFGDEFWICRHCRLTVHKRCYGIPDGRNPTKWLCDPCMNDVTGQYSTCYECVLCPIRAPPPVELFEPPRSTHKKKTDREREKERLEKILIQEATVAHNKRQEEMGWSMIPREALKPTANNNWVHVVCAVFTSQIKFRNPALLEVVEGTNAIPVHKFEQECKICKISTGACVNCYKCPTQFHVTCAQMYDFAIGFDVTPVKSSRKDTVTTIQMGEERGSAEAIICCRDHSPKTELHLMTETQADGQTNALQLFVQHFKQADLSLTGTVRKAAAIHTSVRGGDKSTHRRASVANGTAGTTTRAHRGSPGESRFKEDSDDESRNAQQVAEPTQKECKICKTDASPRWHQRGRSDNVCHRCHVEKLKRAPSPQNLNILPPLPTDLPTVSTPAQSTAPSILPPPPSSAPTSQQRPLPLQPYQQSPAAWPPAGRNGPPYEEAAGESRQAMAMHTAYHPGPPQPVHANGFHTANNPPPFLLQPRQPMLPHPGTHGSPPPPLQAFASTPPHMSPPGHLTPRMGPMPPNLHPSPMPPYHNGGLEGHRVDTSPRRESSGPPAQQAPHPPNPMAAANGLPRLPSFASHGPQQQHPSLLQMNGGPPPGSHPPPFTSHSQPYLPALNSTSPASAAERDHRYVHPHQMTPRNGYMQPPPPPLASAGPPPPSHSSPSGLQQQHRTGMSPSSVPLGSPSHGREHGDGPFRDPGGRGLPHSTNPFSDGSHKERSPASATGPGLGASSGSGPGPREKPNGASASPSLKNLIH